MLTPRRRLGPLRRILNHSGRPGRRTADPEETSLHEGVKSPALCSVQGVEEVAGGRTWDAFRARAMAWADDTPEPDQPSLEPDCSSDPAVAATSTWIGGTRYGELLMGAEVSLVLDDAGDITHLTLTSARRDGRGLAVDLEVEELGEAGLITPEDVGDPARRTVPVDVLEAAGVHALELDALPSGWALTDARETRPGPVLMCEFGGCSRPGRPARRSASTTAT
jgi:hypothetical protein